MPPKFEILIWKYIRQVATALLTVFVIRDIYVLQYPFPIWIWENQVGFVVLLLTCLHHKNSEPKPFIIDRTNQTITYRDTSIPFDDLLHFTVEAATFRDKVVMVAKAKKIDLTGGLSTKKAEKLRDTLVEAVPFTLPRIEFFESKVATS